KSAGPEAVPGARKAGGTDVGGGGKARRRGPRGRWIGAVFDTGPTRVNVLSRKQPPGACAAEHLRSRGSVEERPVHTGKVAGSNPAGTTEETPCSQGVSYFWRTGHVRRVNCQNVCMGWACRG